VRNALRALREAYSPSGFLFGSVIALSLVLAISAVVAGYFGVDVFASLTYLSVDLNCLTDHPATEAIGVHCFGDYYQVVDFTLRADPWSGRHSIYPAAGMLPNLLFGRIGFALNAPRVGLILFLLLLAVAVMVPAWWASKDKTISIRLITIALFGIVSIPALMTLDRGSSVGLVTPALLAFLIGLRTHNHRLTVVSIMLASLVRPQYFLLVAALAIQRKWKHFFATLALVVATNLVAYLFWPSRLPGTIVESIFKALPFGGCYSLANPYPANVSFARGLYELELLFRTVLGLPLAESWTNDASRFIGPSIFVALTIALFILRKTIPAHIVGVLILAATSLFPATIWSYYLVFAIPVAAIALRDPSGVEPDRFVWRGVFDSDRIDGRKSAAVLLVVLATAFTLTRLLIPSIVTVAIIGNPVRSDLLATTSDLIPLLWLVAAIAVVIGWIPRRSLAPQPIHEGSS
jgi:hypothetical protein